MSTLRELKDQNWTITLHCRSGISYCTHSWSPSWDQLIQYFGPDADFTKDRSRLNLLVCEVCGGRGAKIIVQPPHDPTTQGVGGYANHGPPPADYLEKLRREAKADYEIAETLRRETERSRREYKEAEKARKKARRDIESGKNLIGPPNPWAHRKRGRWL